MDVAVVLCTYNRAQHLRTAVESLLPQQTDGKFDFEILIADDASTDDTEDVVRSLAANSSVPIRYFQGSGKGQAPTTNAALRQVEAEWVAFFDDDQLADPRWLAHMVAVARQTGCQCVGSARRLLFEGAQPPKLGRTFRELLGEHLPYPQACRYTGKLFPQGGCSLISREALEKVGYFEEGLPYGGYDTDLFRAARTAGYESWYAPEALVHHRIPAYRVKESYFRWASLRMGANFAPMDRKYEGTGRLILNCIARIAQAILVHAPRLLLARALRQPSRTLEMRCLFWRALSYSRQTLRLVLPRLFAQERFFGPLEFRKERASAIANEKVFSDSHTRSPIQQHQQGRPG